MKAIARRQEEKRDVVGAWGPGETVEKIREKLPGFTTWKGAGQGKDKADL